MPLSSLGIYQFSLAFTALVWADPVSFLSKSDYSIAIKYSYTLIIFFFILYYINKWGKINKGKIAPFLALAFFSLTVFGFLFNLMRYGTKLSYVSAFTSALIFAATAFIPRSAIRIDSDRVLKQITFLFLFCTLCYLNETIVKSILSDDSLYYKDAEYMKAIVGVIGLCITILTRQKFLSLVFAAAMIAALVIRPTSTMVLGVVVCVPLTFALRSRAFLFSRLAANGVLLVAALMPFAFYLFFDQIAAAVDLIESTIKTQALGGVSNTLFRLAIIKEALRQLADTSFIYGKGFDGNTTVFIAEQFPYWLKENSLGLVQIHSDFVIVLTQAGVVGLCLFVFFIYTILQVRMRRLAEIKLDDANRYNLLAISIIGVVAMIVYSSANPLLQDYHVMHPVWLLLFISEFAMVPNRPSPFTASSQIRAGSTNSPFVPSISP